MTAMRSRRALLSLLVPVLVVAVGLPAFGPAPSVRAAQNAPALEVDECAVPLPLPSEFPFAKSEYERILGRFLREGCYLKWHHDKQWRPTGPTVAALGGSDPHVPSWVTTTLGTHSSVVVWYS